MISGQTRIIAHIGDPTSTFRSPLIYNPYFESIGLDVAVVPMGVTAQDRATALPSIFRFTNVHGALITMPHKVAVLDLLDEVSITAKIAGAANAVLIRRDGTLLGDMFDGEGFVRGVLSKGHMIKGQSALVVGAGGVGSAIAASLARAGVARLALYDVDGSTADRLAHRLKQHYPQIAIETGSKACDGHAIVVNATPLGMGKNDPLPMDVSAIGPGVLAGEVVLSTEMTPFLIAAREKGASVQVGLDMLFEQIPAYLEFFGFPTTTPQELRRLARV